MLFRPIFHRTWKEGGHQTQVSGGCKVIVMSRCHHYLSGLQIKQAANTEVCFRVGFIVAEQVGTEDQVPGQPGMLCHVRKQRDVTVRKRGDGESPLEARQAGDGIRPGIEAMPAKGDIAQIGFSQTLDRELLDQPVQRSAMQAVKFGPATLATVYAVHGRVIGGPPCVDESHPVGHNSTLLAEAGQCRDKTTAPVDHRAEGVEHDCCWSSRRHARLPVRSSMRGRRAPDQQSLDRVYHTLVPAGMKRFIRHPLVQDGLSWLLGCYLVFALRTTRWTLEGREYVEPHAAGRPVIVAFWHERLPLMPMLWVLSRRLPEARGGQVHVLVSQHRDGRFIGAVIRRFGINVLVLGSTTRGGVGGGTQSD